MKKIIIIFFLFLSISCFSKDGNKTSFVCHSKVKTLGVWVDQGICDLTIHNFGNINENYISGNCFPINFKYTDFKNDELSYKTYTEISGNIVFLYLDSKNYKNSKLNSHEEVSFDFISKAWSGNSIDPFGSFQMMGVCN